MTERIWGMKGIWLAAGVLLIIIFHSVVVLQSVGRARRVGEAATSLVIQISGDFHVFAQDIDLYVDGNRSELAAGLASATILTLQDRLQLMSTLKPKGAGTWSAMYSMVRKLREVVTAMRATPSQSSNESWSSVARVVERVSDSMFDLVGDHGIASLSKGDLGELAASVQEVIRVTDQYFG